MHAGRIEGRLSFTLSGGGMMVIYIIVIYIYICILSPHRCSRSISSSKLLYSGPWTYVDLIGAPAITDCVYLSSYSWKESSSFRKG